MLAVRIRGCFLHAFPTRARCNNYSQVCKELSQLTQLACASSLALTLPKRQCQWSNLKPLAAQKFCTFSPRHSFYIPLTNSKLLIFLDGKLKLNCKCISSYPTEPNNQKADQNKTPIKDLTKSHLENDAHDFNSILKDIKEDFNDTENKSSESFSSDGEISEKNSTKLKEIPTTLFSGIQVKESEKINTEFQYDYRVAEDIEEYDYKDEREITQQMVRPEKVLPISLTRGQTGVFDLDELLVFLNHLGAENIVTLPIPYEANFCDHMVIASAKSRRHMNAMNEEFLWVHKRKRSSLDASLNIEGFGKSDWSALDLGNIVLHIFYGDAREHYDIESLWTLGPENDPKCKEQNEEDYAMSAESLFWLETAKKSGTDDKLENSQESKLTVNNPKTS